MLVLDSSPTQNVHRYNENSMSLEKVMGCHLLEIENDQKHFCFINSALYDAQ